MKKFILLILMGIVYTNAQVEDITLLSKYYETYTFKSLSGDYESNEDGDWFNCYYTFRLDYILAEAGGEEHKVFWQHLPELSGETYDVYDCEDGSVAVFHYDTQELYRYSDWNENTEEYNYLEIWSKTSVVE